MLAEVEKGTLNYDQDLFYIIYNSFRITIHELLHAYTGLKACETGRINNISTIVNYLVIFGLTLIGSVCCVLIVYLKSVETQINST